MNKTFFFFFLCCVSSGAFAQELISMSTRDSELQSSFAGRSIVATSAAQVKSLRDNTWVSLEGLIIEETGEELYEFRDNSGSVYVNIDDELWLGQHATPGSIVAIVGEMDKDLSTTEIDVKTIRVIK
ncbi:YgiW/YdeI family stress tolerance OB fold protein [Lelliottia sp. WAP21]|uniref:YgiW/YdeI family stress tolerance OB fold protein n=1 Tax=Lelliottia sp. WAP21 TaxID=2877426 RepID=UPI001E655611|nr:NirD/YgiW/YdeI family stress tolerance protein [Lelliottia sp. WAP21]